MPQLLWLSLSVVILLKVLVGASERIDEQKQQHLICESYQLLDHHDGEADFGDMIDLEYSATCNDEFTLPVDEYVNTVYIVVSGTYKSRNFDGKLTSETGSTVEYSYRDEFDEYSVRFTYLQLGIMHGFGTYKFKLTANGENTCTYKVYAPTALVVDGGFTTDLKRDSVQDRVPQAHEGVQQSPIVSVESYYAFGVPQFMSYPSGPLQVEFYSNYTKIAGYDVYPRFKCSAHAYAGPITCDDASSSYYIKVIGVDNEGYKWQRTYDFTCDAEINPEPPTSGVPEICFNGGIMVNMSDGKRECWCPMYFEGYQCEEKQCLNEGNLDEYDYCQCSEGYSGTYCQHVQCSSATEQSFDLSSKALLFIIRATISNNKNRQQIRQAARRIADLHSDHKYYMQYLLITFANGEILSEETFYTSNEFLEAIDAYTVVQDQNCNDILLETLSVALRSDSVAKYPYSPIFLFSDGLTDDSEEVQLTLQHQMSFWRGQVFFVLASSSGICKIEMTDPSYITLRKMAQFSHGLVSVVDTAEIGELVFNLASSLVMGSFVMANDFLHSCAKAPEYQPFFIDDKIQYFYIIATGIDLYLSYTLPSGTSTQPILQYSKGNTFIWKSDAPEYGSYLLTIKSRSTAVHPCQYRVIGRTTTNLFIGLSDTLTDDITMRQPIWRHDSHIVARISDVELSMNSQEIHAEAVIWTNEGQQDKRTVLYASNGILRDGCGYNLYFGAWKCQQPFQTFTVNVFVTDVRGYTMMRTLNGFCSTEVPTETPPSGCLNGGFGLNNGTCICPAHYVGKTCETIECLNGGTIMGSVCGCTAGYTGEFCELAICHKKYPAYWTPHGRSLTIMLHDSLTTRSALRSISANIGRVLENALSHHSQWFSAYQVIRFNSTHYEMFNDISNTGEVIKAVQKIYERNRQVSEVSCTDLKVIPVILDALKQPQITKNGYIILFINGYIVDNTGTVELYEELEKTEIQLNVVLMSSSPCGRLLSDDGVKSLMNFAEFSGGRFFMSMPSRAGEVLKIIPSLYRSSYLYEDYVDNCTTPQTFYFPVDSQTQAFTAYILGDLEKEPKYYYPNVNADSDDYYKQIDPVNVLRDYGTGTRLDQIIRECDDGWDKFDNHCWKFQIIFATWAEAEADCHELNSVLATVYTQAEEDFLNYQAGGTTNFWIGLNNIRDSNEWEWDHFGNNTLLLKDSGYSNWAETPVPDVNKRCVESVQKGSRKKGWAVSECDKLLPYICMKHAYDSEYEPEINGRRNDLARGIWKLQLQTVEGSCYVQLYSQSGIELFNYFTVSSHADSGYSRPMNTVQNTMISHATNQDAVGQGYEGKLEYAHFYLHSTNSFNGVKNFRKRDTETCNYEWISDPFTCPDTTFLSVSTGVDRYGYMYQRLQNFYCFDSPSADDCKNGAVWFENACICEPGYEGLYCEVPICANGNLVDNQLICNCSSGYTGTLCNIPKCTEESPVEIPNRNNKTFILALDGTGTDPGMEEINNNINDILTAVIAETKKNTDWITHYTGVVFRDAESQQDVFDIIETDSSEDFISKITEQLGEVPKPETVSRPIIHALASLLESEQIESRSELFIITAGDVADVDSAARVFSSIARKKVYVNIMLVGDDKYPNNKQRDDPSISIYFDIVESSGGSFYQVPGKVDEFKQFWTSLINTMFDTYFITKLTTKNCSELTEYIQIGEDATNLIVDALTQTASTIVVEDPDGTQVTADDISTNTNHLTKFTTASKAGLYKISIDHNEVNPGFCTIGIRGQSSLVANIAFISDVGIDGGLHTNGASLYPLAGDNFNAIVISTSSGQMNFAQIFSLDQRTLLWSSPLVKRVDCSYPYISANVFRCTEPTFVVAADGFDDDGFPIRRMIQVHCL